MARISLSAIAALSLAALASACSTSKEPTTEVVRSSGETAPADLQLLCASEAASRLNYPGNVLPVSSMPAAAGSYQVNLTLGDDQAVCVIDDAGRVISLERV